MGKAKDAPAAWSPDMPGKAPDSAPRGPVGRIARALSGERRHPDALKAELLALGHPGVRVPPPVIFLVSLLVGCGIDSSWLYGDGVGPAAFAAGGGLFLAGLALIVWGAVVQRRAGTNIEPWKPTTQIVVSGPYRLTRNPMYLGMAVSNIGLAVAAGSIAALGTLLVCKMMIDRLVIDREEAYLEATFGDAYRAYKSRVRRWL